MKIYRTMMALLLCTCLLLLLTGCQQDPAPTTETPTVPTTSPLAPEEAYLLGRESIDGAGNWLLSYAVEEKRTVGQDVYTRSVSGKASFSKLHETKMMAVVEEQLVYGSYSCAYTEVYCDGEAFVQVNGNNFKNTMEPDAFIDRQIPAVLLDSSLYKTITRTQNADLIQISFADAKTLESWLKVEKAKNISASGTAVLDSTGVLKETTYQAEYTLGSTLYEYSATVRVTAPQSLDLGGTHSEHIRKSVELADLNVPKMLLQVVGDVYTSGKIYCEAKESVFSDAIPMSYVQNSRYELNGMEETLSARADYETSMSDYRGEATSQKWMESFQDGRYTTDLTGNGIVTKSAKQMRQEMEDAVLSALMAPIYLSDVAMEEEREVYRLEMGGNRQFVLSMMNNIGRFLRVDLDEQASKSETLSAGGYLTIHKETGLPVSIGLHLEREHVIDDITYKLAYRLDHQMALSDFGDEE